MALATKLQQVPARDVQAFQRFGPMHETHKSGLWRRTLTRMKTAVAALAAVAVIATAAPLKAEEESASSLRISNALQLLNSTRLSGYMLYPSKWDYGTLARNKYGVPLMFHASVLQEELHLSFNPWHNTLFEAGIGFGINIEPVTMGVVGILSQFYEEGVRVPNALSREQFYTRRGSTIDFGAFLAADIYESESTKVMLHLGITTLSNPYIVNTDFQIPKEFIPYLGFSFDF
ncbi:MAG: hypothetical protein N3H30_02865 [Candidatus Micrarchaeota archaeon]|nr:hypothetical protein [Candidatus Micrarchaeota archaeon]